MLILVFGLQKAKAQDPAYPSSATPPNLTAAEYFIDADPGFGNGTPIAITPATNLVNITTYINTAGLNSGVHRLFLRTQEVGGKWSLTNTSDFLVDENPAYPATPSSPGNLVYAEYFFDTDPGRGKGTPIVFSPAVDLANKTISVNVGSLSEGKHTFFLRTLDDWSLSAYQVFMIGSPLPVHLLSFSAKNGDQRVDLEWKTDNELNAAFFNVERSANGTSFVSIGRVAATNQPGVQTYGFRDEHPLPNRSFYRLKEVDKDGEFEYSKVVLVNRSEALVLQIFPNPANSTLSVLLPSGSSQSTLSVIDAKVQTIRQIRLTAGQTNVDVSLEGLTGGSYFIRWQSGDNVIVKPFIKL